MEGRIWELVCRFLPKSERRDGRTQCDERCVLMCLLWSSLNSKPRKWALSRENWTVTPRPRHLLCEGQFSRRARSPRMLRLLEEILKKLAEPEVYRDGEKTKALKDKLAVNETEQKRVTEEWNEVEKEREKLNS